MKTEDLHIVSCESLQVTKRWTVNHQGKDLWIYDVQTETARTFRVVDPRTKSQFRTGPMVEALKSGWSPETGWNDPYKTGL